MKIDEVDLSLHEKSLAFMRIGFGIIGLILFFDFYPLIDDFYSGTAWDGTELFKKEGWSLGLSLFSLIKNDYFGLFLFIATEILFIFIIVGFYIKESIFLLFINLLSFSQFNPLFIDGDDHFLRMALILLFFLPCGNFLSVKKGYLAEMKGLNSPWFLFIFKIQLSLIYLTNGLLKYKGYSWKKGEALNFIALNPAYSRFDLFDIYHNTSFQFLSTSLTYLAIPIEILIVILLWNNKTRAFGASLGIAFHLGINLFIKLRFFPFMMILMYLPFLDDNFLLKWKKCILKGKQ